MASRLLLLESHQHEWLVADGMLTLLLRQVEVVLDLGWQVCHGHLVHHEPGKDVR